ncbi:MAG: S8 family serine peptidase [Acidobacteria bacterium]|nr:S8 family serine peptidase [Acidobacteriota bacterium]
MLQRKFIVGLGVAGALLVTGCGNSGSSDSEARTKNAALGATTTTGKPGAATTTTATSKTTLASATLSAVTSLLAGEAGGVIEPRISLAWSKYAKPAYKPQVLDLTTKRIDPSVLDRLKKVGEQVQYLPVVVGLPVVYDPMKRAAELSSTQTKSISTDGLSERPKVGKIPVITTDPSILAATKALSDYLDSMPDWQWLTRSALPGDMFRAADLFRGVDTNASQTPDTQAKPITGASFVAQLGQTPFVRLLLKPAEIEDLAGKGLITSVSVDMYTEPTLDQSMPVINSDEPTTFGAATGAGTSIAIFDTGVLATHPAFGARVVRQRCYSLGLDCPNGSTSDTSANSALPCAFHAGCDHGTHVAGIAAGAAVSTTTIASPASDGSTVAAGATKWHAGVAPQANILAYRLASQRGDGTAGFWNSDFITAAGDLATIATSRNVVAVNYSVGSRTTYTDAACGPTMIEADFTTWDASAIVAAIDTLQAQNVAVVIAAGNGSSRNGGSFPGCLAEPVSIASTAIEDSVASYSDVSAGRTDLFAPGGDWSTPGSAIIAPSADGAGVNTAVFEGKNGTSMAAPTVAGAWALVRQINPTMNVDSVLNMFQTEGVSVTDSRRSGSVTKPRLNLANILPLDTTSGISNVVATFSGKRNTMSQGAGLTRTAATAPWTGTIRFAAGAFAPNAAEAAYLFLSTRGGRPQSVTVNGRVYQAEVAQSGYSDTPCRAKSPMRSYRVALVPSTLAAENRVSVDAPSSAFVDGASIFLVSPVIAGVINTGSVIITDGLGVMNGESRQMSAALPLRVDMTGRPVGVHVAVADGQRTWGSKAANESGILFKTSSTAAGTMVTSANQFTGSDGTNWDDHTYDLSGKGITGSPGLLVVSHTGVAATAASDCLAFVAAMLNVGSQPLGTLTASLSPTTPGTGPTVDRGVVRPIVNYVAAG